MQNNLRFRAWDKEKKEWFKPTYEAYKGRLEELTISLSGRLNLRTLKETIDQSVFPDRFVVMQSTGLFDKNGKEIYEGDIVFDEDGEYSKTCKIEWHNENAQFVGVDIDDNGGFPMEEIDGEIIGDIYTTPELLK